MMSSPSPLSGLELVDCAKANAKSGLEVAAQQCGYEGDTESFLQNLQQACQEMGIDIEQLSDLITDRQIARMRGGVEIAPDTASDL